MQRRLALYLVVLAVLMIAANLPAFAQGTLPVPARVMCKDGKVVGVQLFAPAPGLVTLEFPPDVCAEDKPAEPAPQKQPQRGKPEPAPAKQV